MDWMSKVRESTWRAGGIGDDAERRCCMLEMLRMKLLRHRACARLALVGAAALLSAAVPQGTMEAVDETILGIAEDCRTSASTECTDLAWRAADLDGDGRLSLSELQRAQRQIDDWVAWKRPDLPPHTSNAIANGSRLVTAVGLDGLLRAFDTDGDGKLSQAEAFADIRLDDRPLAAVVSDPEAIDRRSLSRKLAAVSPMLAALVGNAPLQLPRNRSPE